MSAAGELEQLALACIFPGFEGPVAPDWLRSRFAEGLGGVVLFAWNVESREQLRELTASLRAEGDVLISIDEEGGDVTRLEAATGSSYPGNAALGAVDDVELTERVAASIGADLAEVGVNLNLAPVADVNTNPQNPVIGIRSFGADPELVARHVAAAVRGLQDGAGVAACAKHFPGHGDTAQDSHHELPVVESLEEAALLPFRAAIEAGAQSIMTAHIVVRSEGEEPATMSRRILHELLRDELGFDGLVLTDALEMRAISDTVGVEEGAVRALHAGADALCLGHDLFDEAVVSVRDAIVGAVRSGRLPEGRLVEAAARVRRTAEWASRDVRLAGSESDVGREAARRALEITGNGGLTGPPLVVELEPEPSMAAGALDESPGDWFRNVVPEANVVRSVEAGLVHGEGRQLVIVTRDAHRHEWVRMAAAALLSHHADGVFVELGLPYWHPPAGTTFVATYGAGRVNVEAAAEALYSASRRGVEQSGSSPGS